MKTINVTFTDREYLQLKRAKKLKNGKISWHSFIISLARRLIKNG